MGKEEERKQQKLEAMERKIEKGLKEVELPKVRFDDQKYLRDHEESLETIGSAVAQGLLKKSQTATITEEKPEDHETPSEKKKGKGKARAPSPVPDAKTLSKSKPSMAYGWDDEVSDGIRESSDDEE